MNRRIVIASASSIAAVLAAGAAAFAVTVGAHPSIPVVSEGAAKATRPSGPAKPRVVTLYVDDPPPATVADATGGPSPAPGPGSTGSQDVKGPAEPAPSAAATPAAPEAAPTTNPEPRDEPSTVPTTAAPAPPPGPPAACTGSDDGLTEAQKQAREAACHAAQGGDD